MSAAATGSDRLRPAQDMHAIAVCAAKRGFTVGELNPADSHGVFGEPPGGGSDGVRLFSFELVESSCHGRNARRVLAGVFFAVAGRLDGL